MPKNRNKKTAQSSKSGGGANIIIRQSAGPAETAPTSQSAQIKIDVDDQKLEDIVQKHQPPKPPTQSEQDNTKGEANAGMMNAITGALLGVIPMADKHLGSTASGNDHSLLDLGEEAQTLKRPEINQRLKANLHDFWKVHGIDFALYWLMKPKEQQKEFLLKACPDMLEKPKQGGEICKPTDLLLPELCTEMLLAQQGRTLVAVCQTRALEDVDDADLKLVAKLDSKGCMPIFSGLEIMGDAGAGKDAFEGSMAFVHNGKIVVCDVEREDKAKLDVTRRLVASGKVMDANQWISRNVRQTILLSFCCALVDMYVADKGIAKEAASDAAGAAGAKVQRLASVNTVIEKLGGLKAGATMDSKLEGE